MTHGFPIVDRLAIEQKLRETPVPDGTLFDDGLSEAEQRAEWQRAVAHVYARQAAVLFTEAQQPIVVSVVVAPVPPSPPRPPSIRVNIEEIARRLSKSERTIRRMVKRRRIPFETSGKEVIVSCGKRAGTKVVVGGELSFDPDAVARALDRQQVKAIGG